MHHFKSQFLLLNDNDNITKHEALCDNRPLLPKLVFKCTCLNEMSNNLHKSIEENMFFSTFLK